MKRWFNEVLAAISGCGPSVPASGHINPALLPGVYQWLKCAPLPVNVPLKQQNYLAIDIETSGFDPHTDAILSIGFVPIDDGLIDLSGAEHYYISDAQKISADGAVINQITAQTLAEGAPLAKVLNVLFGALRTRIPIAHGCWMEQQFIEYYACHHWGIKQLPLHWLDTLKIEKARMQNGCVAPNRDVRLSAVRSRYALPEYQAHNALFDAIATAELFQAQICAIYKEQTPSLEMLFRYQRKACCNL